MDVVSIIPLKKNYRVVFNSKGRLVLIDVVKGKENKKLVKIKNKVSIKGNKFQLTFNDGKNIIINSKDKDKYKVGDTLVFDFSKNKIDKTYPFKEKSKIVIVKGKHSGSTGILKSILPQKDLDIPKVEADIGDKIIIIPKDMVYVIPDDDSFKIIAE